MKYSEISIQIKKLSFAVTSPSLYILDYIKRTYNVVCFLRIYYNLTTKFIFHLLLSYFALFLFYWNKNAFNCYHYIGWLKKVVIITVYINDEMIKILSRIIPLPYPSASQVNLIHLYKHFALILLLLLQIYLIYFIQHRIIVYHESVVYK